MGRYMTNKERKLMNLQFQELLCQNHNDLLVNCMNRFPETVEEVLAQNPKAHNPEVIVAMNKRVNAQGERITKLIMQIDPRF